jgi:adenine/guanine phosphoribosyltransferase-like PRPP-binding protein
MIYHGNTETLADLPRTVSRACATIRRERDNCEFDSIVVTGMSGVIVGIPVGLRLKMPVVIVRKDSDVCHSMDRPVINVQNLGGRCLFLDDFVSCGGTFKRVRTALGVNNARVVAKYLYEDNSFEPYDEPPPAAPRWGELIREASEAQSPQIVFEPLDETPASGATSAGLRAVTAAVGGAGGAGRVTYGGGGWVNLGVTLDGVNFLTVGSAA